MANKKKNNKSKINIYFKILNNICFSDYLDRITFQKQIWIFNEMSSLLKTFHNNWFWVLGIDTIFHDLSKFPESISAPREPWNHQTDICFLYVVLHSALFAHDHLFEDFRCKHRIIFASNFHNFFGIHFRIDFLSKMVAISSFRKK